MRKKGSGYITLMPTHGTCWKNQSYDDPGLRSWCGGVHTPRGGHQLAKMETSAARLTGAENLSNNQLQWRSILQWCGAICYEYKVLGLNSHKYVGIKVLSMSERCWGSFDDEVTSWWSILQCFGTIYFWTENIFKNMLEQCHPPQKNWFRGRIANEGAHGILSFAPHAIFHPFCQADALQARQILDQMARCVPAAGGAWRRSCVLYRKLYHVNG